MEEAAGWIAPAATMIAAMMTAANLGPRITGYGFVVFLIGSIAWCVVAALTDQTNLLLTNGFLTLVNLVGIWRWLGRLSRYEAGADAAESKSERGGTALFPVSLFDDQPIAGRDGDTVCRSIGAMAEQDSGRIAYIVVSEGGVGGIAERLHRVEWSEIAIREGRLTTAIDADSLRSRPVISPDDWPA